MRVLPADVYDTLELSAHVFKGIGAPEVGEYDGGTIICPICIYGHAAFVTDAFGILRDPIARALDEVGIDGSSDSDEAVYRINARKRRPSTSRVTFPEWCAELGVVRGA